jgi:hypothetical protein
MIATAGFLVLGMRTHSRAGRLAGLTASALSAGFAAAMRFEGIFAGIPLLFAVVHALRKSDPGTGWRWWSHLVQNVCLTVGLAAVLLGTVIGLLSVTIRPIRTHPEQITLLYDLMALSVAGNEVLIPQPFQNGGDGSGVTLLSLRAAYTPTWSDPVFSGPGPRMKLSPSPLDENVALLKNAWLHALVSHPVDYLVHRWNVMLRSLFIVQDKKDVGSLFWNRYDRWAFAKNIDTQFNHWLITEVFHLEDAAKGYYVDYDLRPEFMRDINEYVQRNPHWAIMQPWVYEVLAALALLIHGWRLRRDPYRPDALAGAAVSGGVFAHTAILFFIVPSNSPRYWLWLIYGALIAVLLLCEKRPALAEPVAQETAPEVLPQP